MKNGHDVTSGEQRFSRLEDSVSVAKRATTAQSTGREGKGSASDYRRNFGVQGCDSKGTVERLKGAWEVVRYFPPSVAQVSTSGGL